MNKEKSIEKSVRFGVDILKYDDEEGEHQHISRRTKFEGERLGVWAFIQKKQQKEGKMNDSKYKKLVAVGFPFDCNPTFSP